MHLGERSKGAITWCFRKLNWRKQRNLSQICEMLLYEGVEAYKKDGPKFIQRLVAKQKLRTK